MKRNLNKRIDNYRQDMDRLVLEKRLKRESKIVRQNSMAVLSEFEDIDYKINND